MDPQIKRDLLDQLNQARESLRVVEDEEKELTRLDGEIRATHKAYKEAYVSQTVNMYRRPLLTCVSLTG